MPNALVTFPQIRKIALHTQLLGFTLRIYVLNNYKNIKIVLATFICEQQYKNKKTQIPITFKFLLLSFKTSGSNIECIMSCAMIKKV